MTCNFGSSSITSVAVLRLDFGGETVWEASAGSLVTGNFSYSG